MKSFIVFAVLIAVAVARPQTQDAGAQTVRQESSNIGVGDYQAAYETSNGIQASEAGQLKSGPEGPFLAVQGQFTYTGPDGQQYTIQYIADENGFQPQGAHIPKNP